VQGRFILNVLILIVLTILFFVADLFFGAIRFSWSDLGEESISNIFYNIRIPKSFTALLAGGSLALAGLMMQTLFRNPLAGPYVLGISSGASLFVAISILLVNILGLTQYYFVGKSIISLAAITGALLVTVVILYVSKRSGSNITVLLVGIMLSQILGAFQGLMEYIASAESLKTFVVWGMGSVSNTTNKDLGILIPACTLLMLGSLFLAKPLNALLLNEAYAKNLGVNVDRLRMLIIIITATITGLITAFCGPVAFIGLSVPIASRLLFKTSHQLHQMTYCMLIGASTLLFCDCICQMMSASILFPVNTITTIIGAPFVIYLIFKSKTIA
jgi:iron complex transport system permease protein